MQFARVTRTSDGSVLHFHYHRGPTRARNVTIVLTGSTWTDIESVQALQLSNLLAEDNGPRDVAQMYATQGES